MKYITFIVWLLLTAAMCLLIIPAAIAGAVGWFELSDKILES
jgi:hypothetical protein